MDAALQAGTAPKLDARKMEVRLSLGPRRPVVLVKADGTVTKEGKHVYEKLGVPAPSIYPYEQGLMNGKWVKNFTGAASAKTLVVGRGGKPTAKGENYFKYNRDEYHADFPVRLALKPKADSNAGSSGIASPDGRGGKRAPDASRTVGGDPPPSNARSRRK